MLSALVAISILAQQPAQQLSRAEFAERWKSLGGHPTIAEVLATLGPPDDVWTEAEIVLSGSAVFYDEPRLPRTRQLWRYGCDSHFAPASLGTVEIRGDWATMGSGTWGGDHIVDLPPETKYRELNALIKNGREGFLHTVEVVNALVPLGEKAAIAVLKEQDPFTVDLFTAAVLSALYGCPRSDQGAPPFGFFEVILVGDLPLVAPTKEWPLPGIGGGGGGVASWPDALSALQKHGKFRTTLLTPPDNILDLEPMLAGVSTKGQVEFKAQMGTLLEALVDWDPLRRLGWREIKDALKGRATRFSRKASRYEWADGTYIRKPAPFKKIWSYKDEDRAGFEVAMYAQSTEKSLLFKLVQVGAAPSSTYAEVTLQEDGTASTIRIDPGAVDAEPPTRWVSGGSSGNTWIGAEMGRSSPLKGSLSARIVSQGREIFNGPITLKEVPTACQRLGSLGDSK